MNLKTALLLAWLVPNVLAHELQDNRATLALRDGTHLSLTLFINYTDALYLALAPTHPFQEFLLVYSAMPPEEFQKEALQVQTRLQETIRVYATPGKELLLTNWVWPDAKQVQERLRQRAMQAIADPGGHYHEPPVEIRADALARRAIASVRVRFPDEFQKVLVVSYRPKQVWVDRKTLSPVIKF